jgi:uncharacterized protein YukE
LADEVRVDPSVLRAGARACSDLRNELSRDEADVEDSTESAASALSGWYTGDAVEQLLWWYRENLSGTAKYLGKFGDALESSARDYEHTDRANAWNFDIRTP